MSTTTCLSPTGTGDGDHDDCDCDCEDVIATIKTAIATVLLKLIMEKAVSLIAASFINYKAHPLPPATPLASVFDATSYIIID